MPIDGDLAKEVNWQTLLSPLHMERLWIGPESTTVSSTSTSSPDLPILPDPLLPLHSSILPNSSPMSPLLPSPVPSPFPNMTDKEWKDAPARDEMWKEAICTGKKGWKLLKDSPFFRHKVYVPPEL